MRSVSGLRGIVGKDLTDDVIRRYAGAFGSFLRSRGGTGLASRRRRRAVAASVVMAGLVPAIQVFT